MDFLSFWNQILQLGESYGVNPLIFAAIYVGAIPFFTFCLAWLIRNLRARRTPVLPGILTIFFFVSAYLYLIVSGKRVPWWVYAVVVFLILIGGVAIFFKIRKQTSLRGEPVDLLVIGGGAAGLTAAGIGAALGAKTVLIEQHRLGGDCTWTGCIPSKSLLHLAHHVHQLKKAQLNGFFQGGGSWNTSALLQHVRNVREHVYQEADHPDIYQKMGITVCHGTAHFVDKNTVAFTSSEGQTIYHPRRIILASGSRATIPPIEGLDLVPYLTNDSVFEIRELPSTLAILGGGPIGIEMAQAFQRLGTKVTVVEAATRILPRDHEELALELQQLLAAEGIVFKLGATVQRVEGDDHEVILHLSNHPPLCAQKLLIATGRRPSVSALNLDKTGINHNVRGIPVNASCRTNIPHIYAVGDVTGKAAFTHMAEHMAKTATISALLGLPMRLEERYLPWVTYTSPELAHVGNSEAELKQKRKPYQVYRFPYSKIDRAVTEDATPGWIRLYTTPKGRLLGADILGERAGDLIAEIAVALKAKMTLSQLSSIIHPYPTYALGVRRASDQWFIRRQSRELVKIIQGVYGYSGPLPQPPHSDRIV